MSFDFDVIVIGSGFGGAVMTYRLAEKSYRVCLLERGRRYGMWEFPRHIHELKEKMVWDPKDQRFGFMEIRDYPESDLMSVSASGLGGGSLIYANVLMRMPAENFQGWPAEINREKLDPYYDKVMDMMEAAPYPVDSHSYYRETPKTHVFRKVAEEIAKDWPKDENPDKPTQAPQFIFPHLAVRFKGDFPGHQTTNKHGALQSSCNKCGDCDIGCNIHAKNTLDHNYIFAAQKLACPATIRTESLVEDIRALPGGGYEVIYCNPQSPENKKTLKAHKVVISAGSLGSTALLLKMKKKGSLNPLSPLLGKRWCGNGDLEGSAFKTKHDIIPSKGPVITSALEFQFSPYPDGYRHSAIIQDAGFPIGLSWYISAKIPSLNFFARIVNVAGRYLMNYARQKCGKLMYWLTGKRKGSWEINVGDKLIELLDDDKFTRTAFILLGMGRDRNDGEIKLRHDGEPIIKWQIDKSRLHYDRLRKQMQEVTARMGGTFVDNPLTHLEKIIAVHPIGGCVMGNSLEDGVVNTRGEVFGHAGLYVVDAAIIPTSIGPNPSATIAALAEYVADQFPCAK